MILYFTFNAFHFLIMFLVRIDNARHQFVSHDVAAVEVDNADALHII